MKSIKDMDKKTKIIVASVVTGTCLIVAGFGLYRHYTSGVDPLARKFKLKDATTKKGELQTPYNVSLETFTKAINDDKYLNDKYIIVDSYNEELSEDEMVDRLLLYREHSLSGKVKEPTLENEVTDENGNIHLRGDNSFYSNIKTFNEFRNPNEISLVYNYKADEELEDVKGSASGIITKLFNKEIAEYIIGNDDNVLSKSIDTRTGKYNLKITKLDEKYIDIRQYSISIEFESATPERVGIQDYKYGETIKPLYEQLEVFKDTEIKDLATKYSDILGDYTETSVYLLSNGVNNTDSTTENKSTISIRSVYDDDTETAVEIFIATLADNSDVVTNGALNIETSTKFREDTQEVLGDTVRLVNTLLGTGLEVSEDNISSGSISEEVNKQICGYDFKLKVDIKVLEEGDKHYGVIRVQGR